MGICCVYRYRIEKIQLVGEKVNLPSEYNGSRRVPSPVVAAEDRNPKVFRPRLRLSPRVFDSQRLCLCGAGANLT